MGALIAPVGGGGLIAGSATAVKGLHPATRVIGVEPEAGDDDTALPGGGPARHRARASHHRRRPGRVHPGELTFAVNRRLLDEVVLVDDEAIKEAMRFAFTRLKIVLEPSGATPLAALLTGRAGPLPHRVGLILSGGNVDAERFARLCAPGD